MKLRGGGFFEKTNFVNGFFLNLLRPQFLFIQGEKMPKKSYTLIFAFLFFVGIAIGNYGGKTHDGTKLELKKFASKSPATSIPGVFHESSTLLSSVLDNQWNLKPGAVVSWSCNAAGYSLIAGPGKAPRFVPTSTSSSAVETLADGDENRYDGFFNRIISDPLVFALAISGTDVYAGGNFTHMDLVAANYIVKWNGTSWSALGSGMNDDVHALAVSGTDIYAGGGFTKAGGVASKHIAKWDGTRWSALGSGMNDDVNALAVSGTDVYAVVYFMTAGGVGVCNIARWDGTSWSTIGSVMNGSICALAVSGTDVYIGGSFTTIGGIAAECVARWNGTSWSALGSGIDYSAYALAVSGTDVYIGGDVLETGVYWWNGTRWSALRAAGSGKIAQSIQSPSPDPMSSSCSFRANGTGCGPMPINVRRLEAKVRELGGAAALLKEVGSFKGQGGDEEEPVFDLGGNVAEWVMTREGAGKTMGGSADRPADSKARANPAALECTGFRVVKGAAAPKK